MPKKDFIELQKEREARVLRESCDFYERLTREYFHSGKKKRATKKATALRCCAADLNN